MSTQGNIEQYYVDYLAIGQLINHYTDIINSRQWKKLDQIFATKAIWRAHSPIDLEFVGLQDIKLRIPENVEKLKLLIQTSSGLIIDVQDNKQASARSYISEFGRSELNNEGFQAVGIYNDVLTKEEGEWKFLLREFELKHYVLS